MATRRVIVPIVLGALTLLVMSCGTGAAAPAGAPAPPARHLFTVNGNRILAPDGGRFVFRAADAVYGRWAGGDAGSYGKTNYDNAARDLGHLKSSGFNAVRLDVAANQWSGKEPGPSGDALLAELDRVVNLATADGLVVEISQESTDEPQTTNLLGVLAGRYRSNPQVLLKLANEPFADEGSWTHWQSAHQGWDDTVRKHGYRNPVIVNCIQWSWDCQDYPNHKLTDANLILGTHRYADKSCTLDTAEVDRKWGNLPAQGYAVFVDEWGNWNDNMSGCRDWNTALENYVLDWDKNRGGSGAVGFAQYWSDANTLQMADGSWAACTDSTCSSGWGDQFLNFVAKA